MFVSKIPVYLLMGGTMAVMAGCGGHSSSMTEPEIPKAKITDKIKADVHHAKITRDHGGMPSGYQSVFTLEGSDEPIVFIANNEEEGINLADLPMGKSKGSFVNSYQEDTFSKGVFMSYQQFYSAVFTSKNTEIKFGDEWDKREEEYGFILPVGLLTQTDGVPTEYAATYVGNAIDGDRFGEFQYKINFKEKRGEGGSIVWAGENAADKILLEGGVALQETLLAAMPDSEDFGDNFYHRGIGVSGKASIQGQEGDFRYDAVLFGPKGEELTGIVYEKIEHDHDHDHDHAHNHTIDFNDDHHHGHDHEDRRNIAAFSGQR